MDTTHIGLRMIEGLTDILAERAGVARSPRGETPEDIILGIHAALAGVVGAVAAPVAAPKTKTVTDVPQARQDAPKTAKTVTDAPKAVHRFTGPEPGSMAFADFERQLIAAHGRPYGAVAAFARHAGKSQRWRPGARVPKMYVDMLPAFAAECRANPPTRPEVPS